MIVSRETSFSNLLSYISVKLILDKQKLSGNKDISGLTVSASALVLLSINRMYNYPLLVQLGSPVLAERLYLSCYNLSPRESAYFPESRSDSLEIPGYNLENERYRAESLNFFRKKKRGLVFATQDSVNEKTIDKISTEEESFFIKNGIEVIREELIEALTSWGYEHSDRTETPKSFSARGGILDVFLPYSANPTRIEFFGNIIESVRIFNPRSQRTIKNIAHIEILPPPAKDIFSPDKMSLVTFLGNSPNFVKVTEEVGLIKLGFGKQVVAGQEINCKTVVPPNAENNNGLTLNSILKSTPPQNIYLFSENNISKTILNNLNLESIFRINNTLENSFYSEELNLCCLSFLELTRQKPAYRTRWSTDTVSEIPQKEFSSLNDLDWGDYLVHQDFGIGLYRGLETIKTQGNISQECIRIEYADNAKVYVPVDRFNRVHRMIVSGDRTPKLSALNSAKWKRQKRVAKDSAKTVVQDLVSLYTSRNTKRGFKYNINNSFMQELETSFPYEETSGQNAAINAVTKDMETGFPVDRLICGDVGFGKTEVALRAALKAIISGKKVLFLTPTTILADQHYISTRGRLEPLGVHIEMLSRFKTKKEQQRILEKMLTGSADLVIGTHRLLSQDVIFPDLGLLIIDEEHRFGVKHKEKLRQLRSTIDVLTLTATPIPRTLQHSLLGIRDISLISTPPKTRRPIKTFVQYFNWENIKTVINNELARGGQIYFLHNDIASIPFILKNLVTFFPNHIIGVAHGKMNSKSLENTVVDFFEGSINILLCTTIIESGLDVSNANTIVINNAQNFGLSQLYQIRGRVGRSYNQAYCYLLLPHGKTIGKDAHKRLKAIEHFTSLGSGYDISLKDLEIRGAGNLFGYKQSGNMAAVGFEMYCKLLQEAVDESFGSTDATKPPPKISIPIDAMLDNKYVALVQDRLYFYQQLSGVNNVDSVDRIEEELLDRFGKLPKPAKNLIYVTRLRTRFMGTPVTNVSIIGSELGVMLSDFSPFPSVSVLIDSIKEKMEINNFSYQFSPLESGFKISVDADSLKHALKALKLFVELFSK